MANSTAGANVSFQHNGAGTRDTAGNLTWFSPASIRGASMAGFSQFDQGNAITTTQNELDLAALNLDGSGSKDLTGLVGYIVYEYISGAGSFLIEPGDTNGAAWHQTVTIGPGATQSRFAVQPMTTGALVTSLLKTVDLTVTGTCQIRMTVYAGASTL